jgi:arabinofuranan 3-O-arabinosyltransferase
VGVEVSQELPAGLAGRSSYRRRPAPRLAMWLALGAGFIALPFLSSPGHFVFDTRDPLWFDPGWYLSKALTLWRATPTLGQEQHDGILFPMALGVWLLRSVGLSMWVAERVWHGIMLFTAAGSTILLVDGVRGRRTVLAPLAAGLLYALAPYVFGYGLPFTPVFLPYVLLPLLLLVTFRGAGRPSLMWPALFGLVTFLMGGGNGAPQIYVLLAAWTLVAWLVFAQRTVTLRRGAWFVVTSFAFFFGLNAWWLFLLSSPEVFNALKFSEQPPIINVTSSASEAIRGLGFWKLYGGTEFGPWITPVRSYITSPILIVTGFAVPIAAVLSAWLSRWRHRLYFLLLTAVAVFVSVGIFPVPSPTAFGHALLWGYRHITGVAGLRTTYKVTAEVNLGIAVLAGVGVEALWKRVGRARRSGLLRGCVLTALVVVVAANGYPLWTGHLYDSEHSTTGIPGYWHQALDALDSRDSEYRAFFAPATDWAIYRWGSVKGSVVQADPRLNAVDPLRLPVAQRYGSNLVAAIEEPYLDGASPRGTARLMRLLGVRDVVLQNDLDYRRSRTASPSELRALLGDPDLQPTLHFGRPGENVMVGPGLAAAQSQGPVLPVEVLSVRDPVPMIRAEGSTPVVLSGDGYGIANAARQGLLPGGAPILYSGAMRAGQLQSLLAGDAASFIVTDTNRREVWHFSAPRSPHSYTLPAGENSGDEPIGYLLFGGRTSTQSTAVYPGLRSIDASGYGARFGPSPQDRPPNAFDGDPNTWWVVANGSTPLGAWIQAIFDRPRRLSELSISQPAAWWLREVSGVRLTFSDGSSVDETLARGRTVTFDFSPRITSSIRVTFTRVSGSPVSGQASGAALSDIEIPGLHPAEKIRTPVDLFDAARETPGGLDRLAEHPITYLFQRARSYYPGGPDEEIRIARHFEVAGTRSYSLVGVVRLNRAADDAQLDDVLSTPGGVTVTSSGRLFGNSAVRGSAAFDDDPTTEWLASAGQPQWLRIEFPTRVIDRFVIDGDTGRDRGVIRRIRAVFSDGSSLVRDPAKVSGGVLKVRFHPRATSSITLFFDQVTGSLGGRARYLGIKEIHVPGVPRGKLDLGAPAPCTNGVVSVDGHSVSVKPLGTKGDLLAGKELPLAACGGAPITLAQGWHDVVVDGGLEADTIWLSSGGSAGPPVVTTPQVDAAPAQAGGFDVHVSDARGPYYLVTGQNWDPHWSASIDGTSLGPPSVIDGYSAGWRIDRPGSYTVSIRYGKQTLYTFALVLTGTTLLLAIGIVAVAVFRRRSLHRSS